MIVAIVVLVLLNLLTWGAVAYFYRHDKSTLAMLLESHHQERMTDQERIDSLIAALANSKGVSYVARGTSGELIKASTWWGDPGRRYWDISRPIVDHVEEKKKEETD